MRDSRRELCQNSRKRPCPPQSLFKLLTNGPCTRCPCNHPALATHPSACSLNTILPLHPPLSHPVRVLLFSHFILAEWSHRNPLLVMLLPFICRKYKCALATTHSQSQPISTRSTTCPRNFERGSRYTYANIHAHSDPSSVPIRPQGSIPHLELRLHDGYTCPKCKLYTTSFK
ncbi:hypothetical protein BKA66DRAFT_455666 [Pyrenochaeta sp. MPI-SDFR-AT-0127]|nr:hypothetical protein BKA66DRAFT_455666 [Pyrenochaeta sp. MPI-SDFR-AT-0127]